MIRLRLHTVIVRQAVELALLVTVVARVASAALSGSAGASIMGGPCFSPVPGWDLFETAALGGAYAVVTIAVSVMIVSAFLGVIVVQRIAHSGLLVSCGSLVLYALPDVFFPIIAREVKIEASRVAEIKAVWSAGRGFRWSLRSTTGKVVVRLHDGREISGAGLAFWLPVSRWSRNRLERRLAQIREELRCGPASGG